MTARLATGCAGLDDLLGGGVERGTVTELFGEAGSGKTNICLVLARNVAMAGRKAVIIDTEGLSLERLFQICGGPADKGKAEAAMKLVFVFEAHDFDEQEEAVNKAIGLAEKLGDVDLIVMDSLAAHYRRAFGTDEETRARQRLGLIVTRLLRCARTRKIPVVLTNQVFTDIDRDSYEPLGGHAVSHSAKAIVRLEKIGPNRRRATVEKHRSIGEGASAEFRITADGIE